MGGEYGVGDTLPSPCDPSPLLSILGHLWSPFAFTSHRRERHWTKGGSRGGAREVGHTEGWNSKTGSSTGKGQRDNSGVHPGVDGVHAPT
jgi:hypothetical protein